MKIINKLITKFRVCGTRRYTSHDAHNSIKNLHLESFVRKDVNWKKVQLRLNNLQHKIYAAKKKDDISYWSRRSITPSLKTKIKLLKRQEDKCTIYNLKFYPGDIIETDHIKPIAKGGKHVISNLQLSHASPCHDYKKY